MFSPGKRLTRLSGRGYGDRSTFRNLLWLVRLSVTVLMAGTLPGGPGLQPTERATAPVLLYQISVVMRLSAAPAKSRRPSPMGAGMAGSVSEPARGLKVARGPSACPAGRPA